MLPPGLVTEAERGIEIALSAHEGGRRDGVLQGLIPTLPEVGGHGMGRVAGKDDAVAGESGKRCGEVDDVVA